MKAHVLKLNNALDPHERTIVPLSRPRRIRALAPKDWSDAPFIAVLNGQPQMRAAWSRKVRDGDVLVFTRLPRGGDNGGSQTLAIIASIALMIIAPMAGSAIAGAMFAGAEAATIAMATKVTTAVIMAAGSALISHMTAPKMPDNSAMTTSPTYEVGSQGNQARIGSAIPWQTGRLKVYPDLASSPYATYESENQMLYQLFALGEGEFSIEDILLEDSPLSSFQEIEYQVCPPGTQVTLFPRNVASSVEVSGQEFQDPDAGTYTQSGTTTVTISHTPGHGLSTGQAVWVAFSTGSPLPTSGGYAVASVVSSTQFRVTVPTSATTSGNCSWSPLIGGVDGFTANAAGTTATRIGIDLVCPRGLYFLDSEGDLLVADLTVRIQAQRINDAGTAIGSWFDLDTRTISAKTVTPVRRSYQYTLATPGRYRVRAWRTSSQSDDTRAGHAVTWSGLRTILSGSTDIDTGVTLIAMKMRATSNLSGMAARRVSVICTRKLPVWNGSSWSAPTATRSIAWAIANAAKAAKLTDAQIDLAALQALDTTWNARGDYADLRVDNTTTAWDVLQKLALAGRARVFMQGGKLRVVRDANTAPVAMFSMRNIKRGSFSVQYQLETEATSDHVDGVYFSSETWKPQRVTASVGASNEKKFELRLDAVTGRAHARREALYHAACNRFRRRVARWSTEMDAGICTIGDTVTIQHDAPGWGQHAEAISWDAGTKILTLSEPVTFGTGQHYIGVRSSQGDSQGPYAVSAVAGDAYKVQLTDATVPSFHTEGTERERTHVAFGGSTTWSAKAKVIAIRPKGLHEYEVEAVLDDSAIYSISEGAEPAPIDYSLLPKTPRAPVVTGFEARQVSSIRVAFSWNPAPGEDGGGYELDFAHGTNPNATDLDWTGGTVTHTCSWTGTLMYGAKTIVRIRALGTLPGPYVAISVADLLGYMWGAIPASAMWNADSSILMWSPFE